MSTVRVVVPLLSSYKYGLLRRRLAQTLLGGARIRRVPYYVYLIQGGLWLLPLALSIPFIILDGLRVWNQYLLAGIYAGIMGQFVLVESVVLALIRKKWRWRGSRSSSADYDDEKDDIKILHCCELQTIDFIFSHKRIFSMVIHPFVSGAFSFVGFFLLLPSFMQECLPTAGVVVVSLFGWFTVCVAHYSLSTRAPTEVAAYRTTDPLELKFLNRPFYVILIGSILIPLKMLTILPSVYYQLFYVCMCLLPLGWALGVLPPLDAFFPWAMEQILTRFLGGSPMATDLRLLVVFIASIVSLAIVVSLNDITSFMLLTAFGFLLSQDVFSNFKAVLFVLSSKRQNRIDGFVNSSYKNVFKKTFTSYGGIRGVRMTLNSSSYLLSHLLPVLGGALLLAGGSVCVYFTSTMERAGTRDLLTKIFPGVMIFLCVFVIVSDSLQRPYIFGIVRNYFYPKLTGDVAIFKRKWKRLHYFSVPRRIILHYISPLVMLVLAGLGLGSNSGNIPQFWQRVAAARLLRRIWQNTVSSVHELTVVSILTLALPTDSNWISLGFPMQALIVGLVLDIVKDFRQKITFVLTSLIAFTLNRKKGTYLALHILIIAANIIFSPLLIGVVLISSILLAPLLSLFTLPVFLTSFPRPQRFWPSLVAYGSTYLKTTEETVYYQQAEPEIAKAVHRGLSHGAIPAQPGTQLLFRFDDRLAVVTILEVGWGFCTINTRGLELQETSCHSEEATRIDDIINALHSPQSCHQSLLNTNLLSTLLLVDSVVIQTYSEARNVLTGIIDQPNALHQFSNNLIKTLIWVFNEHIQSTLVKCATPQEDLPVDDTINADGDSASAPHQRHFSMVTRKEDRSKSLFTTYLGDDNFSWSSITSLELPPLKKVTAATPPENWSVTSPGLIPQDIPLENEGLPPVQQQVDTVLPPITHRDDKSKSQSSHAHKVAPELSEEGHDPETWLHPPLSHLQIFRLMQHFPHDWVSYINGNVAVDSETFELLSTVVLGCFSVLDVPVHAILTQNATTPTYPLDIYKRFCGTIPHSPYLSWMKERPIIWELALKSYRYAVKLMYDEGCLGEVESSEELADYLEEYDQKWCIVRDTDEAWEEAILANTPHLFSLGQDCSNYTAHVLSLQDVVVHIGTLNPAALESIWADLALELLYLTNDDEERYSIQAHPYLLRNLSIQTAEPPLGYTVYSSGLINIPLT